MAPARSLDELLKNLPPGLPVGEARQAYQKRDAVAALLAKGKEYRSIGPLTHITKRGFEWLRDVIARETAESGSTEGGRGPNGGSSAHAPRGPDPGPGTVARDLDTGPGTGTQDRAGPMRGRARARVWDRGPGPGAWTREPGPGTGTRDEGAEAEPVDEGEGTTRVPAPSGDVGGVPPGALMDPTSNTPPASGTPSSPGSGVVRPAAPSVEVGPGGHGGPSPLRPPESREPSAGQREQMQAQLEALNLGEVAAPAKPSPLAGPMEQPDMYARLADMARMMGVTPEKARGIAVAYAFQARDPRDVKKLHSIILAQGYTPQLADSIVATFKAMNPAFFEAGADTPESGDSRPAPTLEDVERRLGLKPGAAAGGMESVILDLDKQERELRIQKVRLELEAQKKALGITSTGPSAPGEEGTIEVVLDIGGMPVPKRIKESQLPMWRPYIAPPPAHGGSRGGDEVPAWAKPLFDRFDRMDRERDEERRRQAEEDRLRSVLAPLYERMGKLEERAAAGGGSESAAAKEIRELRERLESERDRALREQLAELKAAVASATTPEGLRNAQARYDAAARQLGYIPRGEASTLTEEQIQLEAERKAATRKDEATGTAISLAAKRLEDKPVMGLVDKFGLDQVGKKIAQNMFSTPEERAGVGQPPSEEELIAAARALEAATPPPGAVAPPPPAPPPELPPATEGGPERSRGRAM